MTEHRRNRGGLGLTLGLLLTACAPGPGLPVSSAGAELPALSAETARARLPGIIPRAEAQALLPAPQREPDGRGYTLLTRGGHGGSFFIGTTGSPGGGRGTGAVQGGARAGHAGSATSHGGTRPGYHGSGAYHGGTRPGYHGSGTYHGGSRPGYHGSGTYRGSAWPGYHGRGWRYGFDRYYDSLWYYPYGNYLFPFYQGIGGAYLPYTGVDSPYLEWLDGSWQARSQVPTAGVPAATANQSWIVIQGRQFFPREATVSPGSTVVFYNADSEPQRVRSLDGAIDTGILAAGKASAPITVTGPGTFNLSSALHPEMVGVLNVR
ncbi:MAG: hypothetical protein VKQ33_04095 [Candidatus Sericytochromatia bacterium]|nr:hypothetical protein [Candidatus Sericytochromatia bacterium]